MSILPDLPALGPAAVTIGVFDGVHRGHQVLLAATREAAAARGAWPVALVFDPPPAEVLHAGHVVPRLGPLPDTLRRVRAAGVDHALAVRFDDRLRAMAPEEFLDGLRSVLDLEALVLTPDSALGRDRSGTPDRLAELGVARGFDVVVIQPERDEGVISSTRIRAALDQGDITTAARLLGRLPTVWGTVVAGDGRGWSLGYPTANLTFAYQPALPALGIYLGQASAPAAGVVEQPALLSVGVRPTVTTAGPLTVEAHLLDWSGDLYGTDLELGIGHRLRDERRFDTLDALVRQMRRDERAARTLLASPIASSGGV